MATTNIEVSSSHTGSVKYRHQHTWTIDHFSHFCLPSAEGTDPEYESIFSPPFTCSPNEQIQFEIVLYPKGVDEANQDYLSVGFHTTFTEGTAAKVPILFKLSLLNERNKKKYSHEDMLVFTKSTGRAWNQFVERSLLLDPTTGLLVEDQLSILCEIELYCEPVSKLTSDVSLENLKSLSITKISEMNGALLKSGDHSDVILLLDGGKELKAHKAILSAHSPVFKAMLKADMKEKTKDRVAIENLSFEVAKKLVKFIYTGSVKLRASTTAIGLLLAADKYGLTMLKEICGQYLCGMVTTDKVVCLFALALLHSVDQLKRTCMQYIRGHVIEVMLTKCWPHVDKLVIEELRQEEGAQEESSQEEESQEEEDGEEGEEDREEGEE